MGKFTDYDEHNGVLFLPLFPANQVKEQLTTARNIAIIWIEKLINKKCR